MKIITLCGSLKFKKNDNNCRKNGIRDYTKVIDEEYDKL